MIDWTKATHHVKNMVLGELPAFARAPLTFVECRTIGAERPVTVRLGPTRAHLLATPSALQHVLVTHRDIYGKGAEQARLRPVLGEGLITSSGDRWQRARDALKCCFAGEAMQASIDLALRELYPATAGLAEMALKGQAIDLHPTLSKLTIRMVAAALFNVQLSQAQADEIYHAACIAHARISETMWRIIDLDMLLPTAKNRSFRTAVRTLRAHIMDLLDQGDGPLCRALQHVSEVHGDHVLRDEAMTLLIAGFETTSTAATWMVYQLASRPDLMDWLRPELDGFPDLNGVSVRRMPHTRALVQETLRLYPSTWWIARRALRDDRIDGVRIAKGDTVLLCYWTLHRQKQLWPNPATFDPTRFIGDAAHQRDKFAFLPFGAGPRTCIGAQLAMAELTGIAAMFGSAFDMVPLSGPPASLMPAAGVTLGPPPVGLSIKITTRDRRIAA